MSTPSKRRRQARAWMHSERERSKQESLRRAEEARRRTDNEWRERVELIVPPDSDGDVFYPQGKLQKPYIMVAAPRDLPIDRLDRYTEYRPYFRYEEMNVIPIRAVQMAHRLPNGRTIMWWTWEVGRR